MSNYIQGTDDLVNVDFINRDDRNLWYFRSPLLKIPTKTVGIIFTITSFSGNFTNLNRVSSVIKVGPASFNQVSFDGNMQTITVPFIEAPKVPTVGRSASLETVGRSASLGWDTPIPFKKIFQEPVVIEILGDWTRGIETVAIDNVEFY